MSVLPVNNLTSEGKINFLANIYMNDIVNDVSIHICSKNLPNSFSVLAASEENNLFFAPDTYMEKIAIGANLPKNLVDLDNSVEKNVSLLAEAKSTTPNKLTVCV